MQGQVQQEKVLQEDQEIRVFQSGSVDSKVRGPGGGLGDKGISYDLQGRGFQNLPIPKYDYQEEGRVVVEVSVDLRVR